MWHISEILVNRTMQRYSVITDKNPREIVLLRGQGCRYRRCAFCDYHEDASCDEQANLAINTEALSQVTGRFGRLEIVNSGSYCELDSSTMKAIMATCVSRGIKVIHFECHWLYRRHIPELRRAFNEIGVEVKMKIGVESFDYDYRENVMLKGIREADPSIIAKDFNECCLLFGLPGQTAESMTNDIETGLEWFERVCVNIMIENSAPLQPSEEVRRIFIKEVYPVYRDNPRIDILLHNTDFGVGA